MICRHSFKKVVCIDDWEIDFYRKIGIIREYYIKCCKQCGRTVIDEKTYEVTLEELFKKFPGVEEVYKKMLSDEEFRKKYEEKRYLVEEIKRKILKWYV